MKKTYGQYNSAKNKKSPEHDEMTLFLNEHQKEFLRYLFDKYKSFLDYLNENEIEKYQMILEKLVTYKKNDYSSEEIIGYIDIAMPVWFRKAKSYEDRLNELRQGYNDGGEDESCMEVFIIEIKPKQDSFGDIVRQLKYYKHYTGGVGVKVLVTKENKNEEAFLGQDILFIDYNDFKKFVEKSKK